MRRTQAVPPVQMHVQVQLIRFVQNERHQLSTSEDDDVPDTNIEGGSAALLRGAVWRKSSRSGAMGNCVEVAALDTGEFAVRNSRHPSGPALVFTRAEWLAFLGGVEHGEFRPA
jgi:Domain of unknown function (DUF397)